MGRGPREQPASHRAVGLAVAIMLTGCGRIGFALGVVPMEGTFSAWLTSTFDDNFAFGGSHPMVIDAPTPPTTISYDSNMAV